MIEAGGAMTSARDWNRQIIEEFRANEGRVGGPFEGATMLLLHHKGRKSGQERVNPLVYFKEDGGGTMCVFASKGGAPQNPDWYYNVRANPDVTLEVGTERFGAVASVVTGTERDRIYEANAAIRPAFAQYQRNTQRKIPVIALRRK
jgi:deazaflavin-dependent oxidoreductase (nitroreductase family)